MTIEVTRKQIDNHNGLSMSYLEAGKPADKLVVFLHGYPENATSWTAQLKHFGGAGFWCVAPDQRGYGKTTGWDDQNVDSFEYRNLALDVVGLIQALGRTSAIIVAHDFGTAPAYALAHLRPDVVQALCLMAVPWGPRPDTVPAPGTANAPAQAFAESLAAKGLIMYQQAVIENGETAFNNGPERYINDVMYTGSHEGLVAGQVFPVMVPKGTVPMASFTDAHLPAPSFTDVKQYTEAFEASGLRGPINWYRNLPRFEEDMRVYAGKKLQMPFMFVTGASDPLLALFQQTIDGLEAIPGFVSKHSVPNAGHWVQQEAPDAVNALLSDFFKTAAEKNKPKSGLESVLPCSPKAALVLLFLVWFSTKSYYNTVDL